MSDELDPKDPKDPADPVPDSAALQAKLADMEKQFNAI